jgi:hypothetical protein
MMFMNKEELSFQIRCFALRVDKGLLKSCPISPKTFRETIEIVSICFAIFLTCSWSVLEILMNSRYDVVVNPVWNEHRMPITCSRGILVFRHGFQSAKKTSCFWSVDNISAFGLREARGRLSSPRRSD